MLQTVTYACGHTGEVEVYGPPWLQVKTIYRCEHQLCKACAQENRQARAAAAAAVNAEAGLPALVGSQKQVAWAESIRLKAMESARKVLARCNAEGGPAWKQAAEEARKEFFSETSAKWFIDHRDTLTLDFEAQVHRFFDLILSDIEIGVPELFSAGPADANVTAVALRVGDDCVCLRFPKNDAFRAVVKGLGYRWDAAEWVRQNSPGCKSVADVAAQTTAALMDAGFVVSVSSPSAKRLIRDGSWTPINPREVEWSEKYRTFTVRTGSESGDLYALVLALPFARDRGFCVTLPRASARELLDFAEANGFAVSRAALAQMPH